MIKRYKIMLIITSIVILLPMIFGIIKWNDLSETFATHWGVNEEADGYSGKALTVFGLPIILLAFHWLCVFMSEKDKRGNSQNKNLINIILWIIPIISLFANGIIYMAAMGKEIEPTGTVSILFGLLFIVIGNYLPKCRQSFTMGIKIKWTLANEENWNATHRVAGKLWVIGGIVILFGILLPFEAAMIAMLGIILVMVLVPVIYSGLYYKKQVEEGRADRHPVIKAERWHKNAKKGTIAGVIILFAVLYFVIAGAGFEAEFGDESFTVNATGWSNLTVEYSAVENVEYRESFDIGRRISGFGSPTLSLGLFKNDEFGTYTVFAYNNAKAFVIVESDGKVLVFANKDTEITKEFYEKLTEKIGGEINESN
ncbi:MAG: SdpI family protein [Clostridia bacterium]|nr:SdpI family protein [Clostridia bacterium]